MTKLFEWAKGNPLFVGAVLVAVIVVLFLLKDTLGAGVEKLNRRWHDKAIAAEQKEIDKLTKENAKLLEDAKKAYALGEAKGLEADALYVELAKYGAVAKAAADAQKKASDEYEKELAGIAVDVPLLDRCRSLCRERAELGYGCKPSAEDYCRRYSAGR